LTDRGQDPTEIDRLLEVDDEARLAKTILQNMQSQANIDTQLWELYAVTRKKPMPEDVKEAKAKKLHEQLLVLKEEALKLREQQLEMLDKQIIVADARVEELTRKELEMLEPFADVLEEIVKEIKAQDYFLQKGRGESKP
jgi:Sec7-like guanine-nucleotide exchange factor